MFCWSLNDSGPKEEDFVSNLYNRTLLPSVGVNMVLELLESAFSFVESGSATKSRECSEALFIRLKFRRELLQAVAADVALANELRVSALQDCLRLLPKISASTNLGKDASSSFSGKVQRRLASSVPPRPIVSVEFPEAQEFFKRLCEDGLEAEKVFQCERLSSILVYPFSNIRE